MKLHEFNLIANGYLSISLKGEHNKFLLGRAIFPGNERDYTIIRRKFGTMENAIIFNTALEMNALFFGSGLIFKPTKSKTMCRCANYFNIVKL